MVLWQPPEQNQQTQTQDEGVSARRREPLGRWARSTWWPGWFAEGAVPVLRVRSKTHRGHRARRQGATGSGGSAGARAARRQLPRGVQGGGETRLGTSAPTGEVSALVCTSALEMGIDVGALSSTVRRRRAGDGRGAVAAGWSRWTSLRSVARGGGGVRTPAGRLLPVKACRSSLWRAAWPRAVDPANVSILAHRTVRGVRTPLALARTHGRATTPRRARVSAVHGFEADERSGEGGKRDGVSHPVSRRPSTIVRAHAGRPIRGRRFRLESRRGAVEQRRADDVPQPGDEDVQRAGGFPLRLGLMLRERLAAMSRGRSST